ncbi:uncharacterized protein EV422DRAFT_352091 [Fimicolochytrium jonesii]|uniref:uncharacterized protein n=1 Tax=Fimicolochytrium jonesii TaxID=1396493 RepID=UPI0022FDCC6B|nr:uncharacterized protein EV422DRAFT_352091 [Fimicolochytrium jonesii]KAI8823370.1 hypothetical protein EV422DRAFT_352091 [Fimicolochytrium jonesii]
MFEKFIAPVINKILGEYVGNLESKQLSIGIWQGDVALHNLKLRKEALDKFNLPIQVEEGYLGDLTLSIPWNDLKNKPVKIFINHVYLLAKPKAGADYDPVEEEERLQKAKLEKLETADMLLNRAKEPHLENSANDSGFVTQLVTKIVDNVQITMKNIHIRYEDATSYPQQPFSVGVTLEELSAVSCDGNWNEAFIHDQAEVIRKLCKLRSLAIYFNTQPESFSGKPHEEFMKLFRDSIATADNAPSSYQYVLKPISGNAKIKTHKHQPADDARHTAFPEFEDLAFVIDRDQYTSSISLLGAFSSYLNSQKYRKFRPPRTITPALDPIAWFKFAGTSVLSDIQERNRRWTWAYMSERRDDRRQYIKLYSKQKEGPLTPEELSILQELERKLSFDDIMLFRSMALTEMRKSPTFHKPAPPKEQLKTSTWGGTLSNWWAGKAKEESSDNAYLTDDQMKQLYDTIEFDPKVSKPAVELPKDAAILKIESSLKSGSLTLKSSRAAKAPLILLLFEDFNAGVTQYPSAISGTITLANMKLEDGSTVNTLYPTLIRAKKDTHHLTQTSETPFFSMGFEHNPLDGRADDAVSIVMLPLEVIYNPTAIKSIVTFFTPPVSESATVYTIQAAAQETFEGLTQQTKAGVEHAVTEHRTLDLKVDFAAPIFVFPQSCTDRDCMVMLVDAGHFLVESNYINKEQKKELQQKHGALRSAEDLGELQTLLYDRFTCQLSSVQVLVGPSMEACMQQIAKDTEEGHLHMVERVNLSISLELCILPKLVDLPGMRVTGNVPRLHLNVSDRKYKTMMSIIDLVLANMPGNKSDAATEAVGPVDQAQPHWLTPQDRGTSYHFLDAEDEGESFYDAPEQLVRDTRSEMTDDSINRVAMEVKFEVSQVSISVTKSDANAQVPDRVLAALSVEGFGINVRNTTHDMAVKIRIRAVQVEDLMMQDPESQFHYLFAPTPEKDTASVSSEKSSVDQLIRVNYLSVKPSSPDYNGIDQSVDISFAAVTLVLTSSSVLTLYDFILATFTNQAASANQSRLDLSAESEDEDAAQVAAPSANKGSHMVVHVVMKSIGVVINQDGTHIATMDFGELETNVDLMPTTMKITGSIGDLAVRDEIPRVESRHFDQLLQIEGEEVAHFTWETFDSSSAQYPGYDTALVFRASSFKLTYLEALLLELIRFFSQFAKMHMLLETARRAAIESAQQIQKAAGKFHYDIEIESPAIVFPRLSLQSVDTMTLYPGGVSASNRFQQSGPDEVSDKMTASIRAMKIVTYLGDESHVKERQMLDDVNISVSVDTLSKEEASSDMTVHVEVSDVHMILTPGQFEFLLTLADSLATFNAGLTPESSIAEMDDDDNQSEHKAESVASTASSRKVDVSVSSICLDILSAHTFQIGSEDQKSLLDQSSTAKLGPLATFAAHGVGVVMVTSSDGSSETDVLVQSFAILDARESAKNLFKEIMPLAGRDKKHQLKIQMSTFNKTTTTIASLSGATLVLIPDHVFLVRDFFTGPMTRHAQTNATRSAHQAAAPKNASDEKIDQLNSYRMELLDVEIILLQNATASATEAIVLSSKNLSIQQDKVTTVTIEDMGMFLCQMDKREDTSVPFIQNFQLKLSLDSPKPNSTKIILDISPIIWRVSYRDGLLIMDIVNNIHNLWLASNSAADVATENKGLTASASLSSFQAPVMDQERIRATIQAFRLILIDDLNDLHLPMLDLMMDKLVVDAADWSTSLRLEAAPSLHCNYFNITNSHWEPLIEQWQFFVTVAKRPNNGTFSLDLFARKKLEINITHAFVRTILQTQHLWSKQDQRVAARRGAHAPYVLRNKTGYDMYVWTDSNDADSGLDTELKMLPNGEDIPWRFEDWRTMREGTSPVSHRVSMQLNGPSWETLKGISIDSEGVKAHILRPPINRVSYRLVCDVKLKDNVKVVTFHSTVGFQNNTTVPLEVVVVNQRKQRVPGHTALDPGQDYFLPIESSYNDLVQIRPAEGFGYDWCSELLNWRDLQKKEASLVTCRSMDPSAPAFRFQVGRKQNDPKATSSPMMMIQIIAPLQIENGLPYDIRYKLFDRTDRNTRQQFTEVLKKGECHPVYTVNPTHLIALSGEIVDSNYSASEPAIITNSDLDYRDESLRFTDKEGQQLQLRLKYHDKSDGGGPRISILSPYVVLNKTGMDVVISTRSLMGVSRYSCPAAINDSLRPLLFSFPNFEPLKSRVQVKVPGSEWSRPISFDAVGSSFDVAIQNGKSGTVSHIGVSVSEGEGKFYMTKVITLAPRFIFRNNMTEDIQFRQNGATETFTLKSTESMPFHTLKLNDSAPNDFCIRLSGLMNEWSRPFDVNQVGRVYIKLGRLSSAEQDLIRAEVLIKDATIFIVFTGKETRWPFKINNKTDIDIDIWQQGSSLRFKIPKGESRPYAWDYPSAPRKGLVLNAQGREREIDVLEIGQLVPFKYPTGIMSIHVFAEGPTICVDLATYSEATSAFKNTGEVARKSSDQDAENGPFRMKTKKTQLLMAIQVQLEGIGISLLNSAMQELVYLSARQMTFIYTDTSTNNAVTFSIKWLQIDNQLYGGLEPIFVYPSVIPKEGEGEEDRPVLLVTVSRSKDQSYGVDYYDWFTILLQELSVDMDEEFLMALLDFSKFNIPGWNEEKKSELIDASVAIEQPPITQEEHKMYFEKFLLQPIQINVSFVRTQNANMEEARRDRTGVLSFVVDVLTMTLGNIHDAPIRLKALELRHPNVTPNQLADLIFKFYTQELVGQVHKVIGSADFLGNPVGLFNNVSSGVSDLFYEPLQGFDITRPQDFGIGVAKGASSLFRKTVFGASDTFSKFTGSVGKGLSVITMDSEFQERRRLTSIRNRPRHAVYGVTTGATSLARSVASGITGLVSKPIEGADAEGVGGFFKGIGKGIVGVVTKPVVGVFDLATNVGEGIRNTTTVFDADLDRTRLPRFIGKDRVLVPYNPRDALGLNWLKGLENGRFFHEDYIAHLELRIEDLVAIVTDQRIVMARIKRLKMDWDIGYDEVQNVRAEGNSVNILRKGRLESRLRVIPCPDVASAQVSLAGPPQA